MDAVTTSALMLRTMIMKTGNYGLPLARFVSVKRGFQRAVLFFVIQATLAQTLAVLHRGGGSR